MELSKKPSHTRRRHRPEQHKAATTPHVGATEGDAVRRKGFGPMGAGHVTF